MGSVAYRCAVQRQVPARLPATCAAQIGSIAARLRRARLSRSRRARNSTACSLSCARTTRLVRSSPTLYLYSYACISPSFAPSYRFHQYSYACLLHSLSLNVSSRSRSLVGTILLNAVLQRGSQVEKFCQQNSFSFFATSYPPLPTPPAGSSTPSGENVEGADTHKPVRFLLRVKAVNLESLAIALTDAGLVVNSK